MEGGRVKKGFGRRARGATSDAPTLDELAKISREIGIVGTSFLLGRVRAAQDAATEVENGREICYASTSRTSETDFVQHRPLLDKVILMQHNFLKLGTSQETGIFPLLLVRGLCFLFFPDSRPFSFLYVFLSIP